MKADLGFAFKAGAAWAMGRMDPGLERMQLDLRDNFNVLANRYNLAPDWAKRFAENPLGEVELKKPENHG